MNYGEALQYLSQRQQLGIRPGTERLAVVLDRLGNPQDRYLALHIAGTNGKGSTAAFSAQLLLHAAKAAGEPGRPSRIGLYTSPHLHRLCERIQIYGDDDSSAVSRKLVPASEEELAAAMSAVRSAADAPNAVELTFFELLTATAFLLLAERGVTVAVI